MRVGAGWVAWGVSCAVTVALTLTVGCGESTSDPGSGAGGSASTMAGTSSTAGAPSTSGASGGGQPSTAGATSGGTTSTAGASNADLSQDGACLYYVEHYCTFLERCRGGDDAAIAACVDVSAERCPDLLFSEGSTRTPEGLRQCAQVWTTWTCDDLGKGLSPDCVTPGTKALGEACAFPSQCASLSCSASRRGCGVCEESSPPEGPCADGERCGVGQLCVNGTTCVPDPEYNQDGKPGDTCSEEQGCNDASYCSEEGVCMAQSLAGGTCAGQADCAQGLRCNYEKLLCESLPGPGEACSMEILSPGCADGSHCEEPTCALNRREGEPCYLGSCDIGFSCRDATPELPGTCKARGSTPNCGRDFDCSKGSVCRDDVCKLAVAIGDVCDATHGCPERSECANGRCQPGPLQGLFAMQCPQP